MLAGQSRLVSDIDARGFAAAWVRDIPLYDPRFGDAGQLFDPFTYLAYLAARTQRISPTGSAIFSLRHPIDLAKSAATIDQLSGGRLVMGIASGDRPIEFPAYGLQHDQRAERFAQAVVDFRRLLQPGRRALTSPLGHITDAELPCPSPPPAPSPARHRRQRPIPGLDRRTRRRLAHLSRLVRRPRGPQGPGPENPGLARPHPRRRLPPSRHQRMDRPGRRPHAPAHPAARRASSCRSAATRSSICSHAQTAGVNHVAPGHPVLTPPRRRSHPGIGGGSAAALPVA